MNIISLQDKNLYYIGGIVRDKLLGKDSFDIDITYEGDAIEFAKTIQNAEIVQINEPFGTVKIKLNGEEIDIASTRCETYPLKGHLPLVSNIGCSLKEDVLRRDFTINALAQSTLTEEITDYTGGLNDIKNKVLRVLHNNSFIDDPTRIVRGLKFTVRFGFELEEHTKKLQNEYLKNINYDMSYKRLKKELIETFNLNSNEAFEKFVEQKIYKLITPQDFNLPKVNLEEMVKKYNPKNIWIIYVGLIPEVSKLPLNKVEKKIVEDFQKLCESKLISESTSDFDIYKNFDGMNLESILMFATINKSIVIKYLDELSKIKLEINGSDLQNMGIKPSPKYQECFNYILEEKIKNPAIEKPQEIQLAKKFFKL
ncbi:CCA tRNA nucleotidyltransferase [bacterium]|nr:CCA tRNA nucleotidyltransferase [bacterium]